MFRLKPSFVTCFVFGLSMLIGACKMSAAFIVTPEPEMPRASVEYPTSLPAPEPTQRLASASLRPGAPPLTSIAEPFIELLPLTIQSGDPFLIRGRNFCAQSTCSALSIRVAGRAQSVTIKVNADGTFQTSIIAGQTLGAVDIEVTQDGPNNEILRDLKTLNVVKPSQDETNNPADAKHTEYPPAPPLRPEPAGAIAPTPHAPAIRRPAGPTTGSLQLPLNVQWGGRVVAIDVNPADRSSALVASDTGGLFATNDTGLTWRHVDALPIFRMSDVKYADTVGKVVIASGIYNTRVANDGGIWRSIDGGSSWLKVYGSIPPCSGGRVSTWGIAVVPLKQEVYVGTDCGLAISRDEGLTWTHVSNYGPTLSGDGKPMVIAVAAEYIGGPASIVDICGHYGHRRSIDGGVTWPISDSFGVCPDYAVHALAQSPVVSDPNVLFLSSMTQSPISCLPGPALRSTFEVFESDDAGMNWTSLYTRTCSFSRPPFVYAGLSKDLNPTHVDIYFSDGVDMHRLTCAGTFTGNRCGMGWSNPTIDHTDINALAYDPASASHCAMYVGNDASIYGTTPASCGAAWTETGTPVNGYNALQVYDVQDQVHPGLPTDFYFGTQDNDLWASPDNGTTWPGRTIAEGFGFQLNHSTPSSSGQTIVWTSCADCFIHKGGPMFSSPSDWNGPPNLATGPVLITTGAYIQWGVANPPTDTSSILYHTTNTGGNWTHVQGITITDRIWGAPLISGPSSNPTIYQGVQRAGGTWGLRQITGIFGATPVITRADVYGLNSIGAYCLGWVCPIVYGVDPYNALHLIAADIGAGQMITTIDGGAHWYIDTHLTELVTGFGSYRFSTGGIVEAHYIQWDPANRNRILVTTDEAGTIESTDNGVTWSRLYDSRRVTNGTNVTFDEVHNRVIEATFGRGLWELDTQTGTDVSITLSAAPFVGHYIHYVITATNLGPLPAIDMHFKAPLPQDTYYTAMSAPDVVSTGWNCGFELLAYGQFVQCGSTIPRTVGESVRLEFTVHLASFNPTPGTTICETATVVSEGVDPNEANNTSTVCSQTVGDLQVNIGTDDMRTSCQGIPGDCSLRGAITKVDSLGAEYVSIGFSNSVTTVNLTGTLPTIAMRGTTIQGFPGFPAIRGDLVPSGDGFVVNADEVTIDHLILYGLPSGGADVHILGGRHDQVSRDWLGVQPEAAGDTGCFSVTVTRNADIGILVDSTVHGTAVGDPSLYISDNRIGCHSLGGIALSGVSGAVVGSNSYGYQYGYRYPNYIGTNTHGVALPNGVGIRLFANGLIGARNNAVYGNIIANNNDVGIWLNGSGVENLTSTSGNLISGNLVISNGLTNPAGGIKLTNAAFFNVIGGDLDGAGNDIEGNNGNGISIYDSNSNGVLGNTIGNQHRYGVNKGHGVLISNGVANWVGGFFYLIGFESRGNTIGGNTGDGVQLINGANLSMITGNTIGTNISASTVISNWGSGVTVWASSYSNTIGISGNGNIIGGNGVYGIYVAGAGSTGNTMTDNSIGHSPSAIMGNGSDGITLQDQTYSNIITGNNTMAYNASGVWVTGGAHDNLFHGGTIFKNSLYGILFDGATTSNNTVDSLMLNNNGWAGVGEKNNATNNVWTHLSTYDNGGLGIDVAIPGDTQNILTPPMPVITEVVNLPGILMVRGVASPSLNAEIYTVVELYMPALDPTGYGEGRTHIGSTTTNLNGNWEIDLKGNYGSCFTAFQTYHDLGPQKQAYASSGEYGMVNCHAFVAMIRRP